MKQLLLISLGLALLFPAYSQNYQSINSSEVKLYNTVNLDHIRGYRVDSVVVIGADSLLYPSRTIQSQTDGCFNPMGPSMLGDYVRVMPDGTNIFFNLIADTIRIKTMAQPGELWKVWSGETFDIYGEMLEPEAVSVFGVADSAKSIKLNAYDNEMNPVEEFSFNDSLITISKNHGFLKTFNFVIFPNIHEAYFDLPCQSYELYGLENQSPGGGNLTTFDIFDFQPGNIIEFETEYISSGQETNEHVREEFISRNDYQDSIIYVINTTISTYVTGQDITLTTSQVSRTIKPMAFLDDLPGLPIEVIDGSEENGYFSVTMGKEEFLQKNDLSFYYTHQVFFSSDDCYALFEESPCLNSMTGASFYKGLGGPYYHCGDAYPFLANKHLTYFLKDSVEWGFPYDFTLSLEDNSKTDFYEIYPNPATNKVKIRLHDPNRGTEMEIVDVSGRKVFSKRITSEDSEIDISNLKSGLYFIWFPLSGNESVQKLLVF